MEQTEGYYPLHTWKNQVYIYSNIIITIRNSKLKKSPLQKMGTIYKKIQ